MDWPEPIKAMQRNWIGRSEGCEIVFQDRSGRAAAGFHHPPRYDLWCDILRPGARASTGGKLITTPEQRQRCEAYRGAGGPAERNRAHGQETREKTGVFTGGYVINPLNGERVPVWIADYVLLRLWQRRGDGCAGPRSA